MEGRLGLGLEGAWATGPFSVQAEYLRRKLKADQANNDMKASGYYAQMAYTLTGEPRIYKLDGAKFDTIKPENKELGAWKSSTALTISRSKTATWSPRRTNRTSARPRATRWV
ncbi:porin [Pseudomonas parakoreensis]